MGGVVLIVPTALARVPRIVAVAIAALAVLPAVAPAATVAVTSTIEGGFKGPEVTVFHLRYTAAAGERNSPTITREAGGRIAVDDATAPLTAGTWLCRRRRRPRDVRGRACEHRRDARRRR